MCRKHSGRGGGAGVHRATGTPQQSAKGEAWQRALIKRNTFLRAPSGTFLRCTFTATLP